MNKNIKQLMESLFDEETDNMLASDKDSINNNNTFAEKITDITIYDMLSSLPIRANRRK